MIARRALLKASRFAWFGLFPFRASGQTRKLVNVADFGARGDGVTDCSEAVNKALSSCPAAGGTLYFPRGRYFFAQQATASISIKSRQDFTLAGDEAELLFGGDATAIQLQDCQGVHLHDFSIDWLRPAFSQGVVVEASRDHRSLTVHIDDAFPVHGGEPVVAIDVIDPISQLIAVDGTADYEGPAETTLAGPQLLKITLPSPHAFDLNTRLLIRHKIYGNGAIRIDHCQDVRLDHVHVRTAPGMAVAGAHVRNLTLDHLLVAPRRDSGRALSSTADGVHFWGGSGEFTIRNCQFSGLGDDGVNIHDYLYPIGGWIDENSFRLAKEMPAGPNHTRPLIRDMWPAAGDTIDILAQGTLQRLARCRIAAVEPAGDESGPAVQLSTPVARPLWGETATLCAGLRVPRLTVSASSFNNSRGRGVLMHATAVIEGCHFTDLAFAGASAFVDNGWAEGPLVRDVRITKNSFARCGKYTPGTIRIGAVVRDGAGTKYSSAVVNTNVVIDANTIEECYGNAIEAGQTDMLEIVHNDLSNSDRTNGDRALIRLITIGSGRVLFNRLAARNDINVRDTDERRLQITGNVN